MTVNRGEFGIIKEILSPLAAKMPGAFGLTDDAACLSLETGRELVLTKDAMVAGIHFLDDDPPSLIAKKLLRTNLSDLASMGARPEGYLLATAWPDSCDENWIREFAAGLKDDQDFFNIGLLGGDTVRTPGPLTLSLTALGSVKTGKAMRRNGAKVGDIICVSGTIGDGAFGLKSVLGKLDELSLASRQFLENRYRLPMPRLRLGEILTDFASSCLDISDGLVADIGHICEQSDVGALLYKERLPISKAGREVLDQNPDYWGLVFGGGDDYELAFSVPPDRQKEAFDRAEEAGIAVTAIGTIVAGDSPQILDSNDQIVSIDQAGYKHF